MNSKSLRDDLAQAVQRIFQHARDEASLRNKPIDINAEAWQRVAVETRACFEQVVASELCKHNEMQMSELRLPEELWTAIWGHLPMRSLLSVTHVCRTWRSLGLATPSLWSTLDVVNCLHDAQCNCPACLAVRGCDIYCGRCRSRVQSGWANTDLLQHLLPRSKSLPLSLVMDITGNVGDAEFMHLADVLSPQIHRLVHVHWSVSGPSESGRSESLFRRFDELPALVSLSSDRNPQAIPSFSRKISLPNLKRLSVQWCLYTVDYDRASGPLLFPSATILDYAPSSSDIDLMVRSALLAVPNATTLNIKCDDVSYQRTIPLDYRLFEHLLERVKNVHMTGLREHAEVLISVFHRLHLRSCTIELNMDPKADYRFAVESMKIFTALGDEVKLSITYGVDHIRWRSTIPTHCVHVDGVDSQGRHRRVRRCIKGVVKASLWDHLEPSRVSSISIDAAVMSDIMGRQGAWSAVHELAIILRVRDSFAFDMPGTALCLPALRTLRLVAHIPFTSEPSVGVEELVSFVGNVQIEGGVLDELVVQNVVIEGDLNCLAGLIRIRKSVR